MLGTALCGFRNCSPGQGLAVSCDWNARNEGGRHHPILALRVPVGNQACNIYVVSFEACFALALLVYVNQMFKFKA